MMTAEKLQSGISLAGLLSGLVEIDPDDSTFITGLCSDSRKVQAGDLFCARAGSRVHAASFIPQAVKAGAVAVLMQGNHDPELPAVSVPVYRVDDFNRVLGEIASRFFERPSEKLEVIGITGTNGKTSITWLLAHAMSDPDHRTGMIGTLGIGMPNDIRESINTTPDAITIHGSLATLRSRGAQRVAMEVSSHALEQGRVAGVRFKQALFTNLSRDHLDYHVSMQAYAAAKQRLFREYPVEQQILNLDDPLGREMWQSRSDDDSVFGFTFRGENDGPQNRIVTGQLLKNDLDGLLLGITSPWGTGELRSKLLGSFYASNLIACLTSMCLAGISIEEAIRRLQKCPPVPGRMERLGADKTPLVIVDYAHTPDALENVLASLKPHVRGKLVCVFGCGGERDSGKRAGMGRAADQYADEIIVTNDNPRGEDPEHIIQDILTGIERSSHLIIEPDRSTAITTAIRQAGQDDLVLVAGKGHETSQLVRGEYLPFSDRNLVRACLEAW